VQFVEACLQLLGEAHVAQDQAGLASQIGQQLVFGGPQHLTGALADGERP
jgi:hypothetical protein